MKNSFLFVTTILLLVSMRPDLMTNRYRDKILNIIKTVPGIYFSEIVRDTGINRGTLRYHIDQLEKEKIIESRKVKGKVRFFMNDFAYCEKEKILISILKNEINRKIVDEICKCNNLNSNSIAEKLGVSASTLNWHLKHIKEHGIIEVNKDGKNNIYNIDLNYYHLIKDASYNWFEA